MARRQRTWLIDPAGPEVAWLCLSEEDDRVRIIDAGVERGAETPALAFARLSERASKTHNRPGEVVVLVPPERLAARSLQVGRLSGQRLRQAVSFEITEALGMEESGLCWDVLGEGQDEVCWLAARRMDLDDILEALPPAFTEVSQVVPGLVAGLAVSTAALSLSGPVAYVVSRAATLSVAIRTESQIAASRTVAVREADNSAEGRARLASRELPRLLLYAEEQHPEINLRVCVVVGLQAGAVAEAIRFPGIDVREVHLETIVDVPELRVADTVQLEEAHTELLGVTWSRATRRALPNLLPMERRIPDLATVDMVLRRQKSYFAAAAMLVMLCVGMAAGGRWLWADAVDLRADQAEALLADMSVLRDEESGLREVINRRVPFADFFMTLSKDLPESVTFEDATFDLDGRVNIKGKAGGNTEAKQVLELLNGTEIFSELKTRRTANEEKGFTFEIEGTLKAAKKKR